MATHSAATRKKISDGLKKYYASGGKKGAKQASKDGKSKLRNGKYLQKNPLHKQALEMGRKITLLRNQVIASRKSPLRVKSLRSQIHTLQLYRRALMKRIKSIR